MPLPLLINFSCKNSFDKGWGKNTRKALKSLLSMFYMREVVEGKRLDRMAKDLLCCVVYKNKTKQKKIMMK